MVAGRVVGGHGDGADSGQALFLQRHRATEAGLCGLVRGLGRAGLQHSGNVLVGSGGELPAPLLFYTRYVLPLSIVAVPYLWKWLLDLHPDSQERIVTLEVEAQYTAQWRDIQQQQNDQLIGAYQAAIESPEVKQAVTNLVQKAALKRAVEIVGHIDESVPQFRHEFERKVDNPSPSKPTAVWRGGQQISGDVNWEKAPKV